MYPSLMPDLIAIEAAPAESLRIASRAGFLGLDLRLNRFADEIERLDARAFAAAIEAAGLIPGYCSIAPQKIDVPEEQWRSEMADVPRRAALAEALGYRRSTSVVLPGSDDRDFESNMAHHVERVREVVDLLAPHSISFGLEYVSPLTRRAPFAHGFVHDLDGMLGLLGRVDRPGVGVMLDCFHWRCAGEGAADLRRLSAEQIIAVHVNDLVADVAVEEQTVFERELPGESGLVDIGEFLRTLSELGYDGPITAEPTHPKWRNIPDARAAQMTRDAIAGCLRGAGISVAQPRLDASQSGRTNR